MNPRHFSLLALASLFATASCGGGEDASGLDSSTASNTSPTASTITVAPTTAADFAPNTIEPTGATTTLTTLPPVTTTTSTTTTTTTTTTTVPPTTVPAVIGPTTSLDLSLQSQTIGTSVGGRPIVAERFGEPGGRRVLVTGVIHGNEDGGVPIIDLLRTRGVAGEIPPGVELWLIESMNPDGQTAQDRQNANDVDLNRNFPYNWGTIGEPGDSQYAGPAPASEPETQTMVAFITALRPDLALWFHQDANLIIPGTGRDGAIRARYAELTALPLAECCDGGGIYTGIAATWARNAALAENGVAFIVELPGGDLAGEQVEQHANAVLTVASEL